MLGKATALRQETETVKTALAKAERTEAQLKARLTEEQEKVEALEAEKIALEKAAELIETALASAKAADDEAEQKLLEEQRKSEELEQTLHEKEEELLAVQKEIEKLRADLIYQDRTERVAYAHTNTFFIKEEKMGRFYRDAMYASDTKTGF